MALAQIIILGLIIAVIFSLRPVREFFRVKPVPWDSKVSLLHVLIAFAIYFGISLFVVPVYIEVLRPHFLNGPPIGFASWINFLNSLTIFIVLGILLLSLPKITRNGIFFRAGSDSQAKQLKAAAFAWLLSFPLVLFLTSSLEELALYLFNVPSLPDQLAVYFVKMTFANPIYFAQSILTIVIITPFVEETLFRGFLQSFIRRHLGSTQAIFITAACFALFHYSSEQGLANIPIVGSLFTLALFLGFLYEKQGTLFAPIYLHAIFNGISILNLYFLGGIPCFF